MVLADNPSDDGPDVVHARVHSAQPCRRVCLGDDQRQRDHNDCHFLENLPQEGLHQELNIRMCAGFHRHNVGAALLYFTQNQFRIRSASPYSI